MLLEVRLGGHRNPEESPVKKTDLSRQGGDRRGPEKDLHLVREVRERYRDVPTVEVGPLLRTDKEGTV